MKKFLIDGKVYTFDVIETKMNTDYVVYAKCRENGKYAWIDIINGVQFEGEKRIVAEPVAEHYVGYNNLYQLWGGELRPKYNWQKTPVKYRY